MKKIAIIGAGIAGLRASLELCQNPNNIITVWEKSASVGGRVATRRYGEQFVNHGINGFDSARELLNEDPLASHFSEFLEFNKQATLLPKAMHRLGLEQSANLHFHFNQKITKVDPKGVIWIGDVQHIYDHVLITAPMAQISELLQTPVHPEVRYSKKILFIGVQDGKVQRLELSDDFSESHFEQSDELIRMAAEKELKQPLTHLDLKKWRYSRVLEGVSQNLTQLSQQLTLAGDAFDPSGNYDLKAAWLSGLKAARSILEATA